MKKIKPSLWSKKEIIKLLELKELDFTYSHIGSILGRSSESVRKKYKKVSNDNLSYRKPSSYSRPWNEEEMSILYEMRRDGVPYKVISQELKRTVRACRSKYLNTNWDELDKNTYIEKRLYDSEKNNRLEAITRIQDRRLQNMRLGADIISDRLVKAVSALPEVINCKIDNKSKKSRLSEDALIIVSDIHIGAVHTLEETGGLSQYNLNILEKRLERLAKRVHDITELHRCLYDINTLHVACLGDIVAGMNNVGMWSPNYINMSIMEQFVKGWHILEKMLNYWLSVFPKIKFYGVRGNHGRASKRGEEKDYVNWDSITYLFLKERFSNNPRIEFVVPQTWWVLEEINNHKFLMVHGDDVKSKGLPLKGLLDFETQMTSILKEKFHYTLAGHFHNSAEVTTNNGKIYLNGSVVGSDVYSLKDMHSHSKPEQTFLGVHPRRGVTWKYDIDLSDD